MINGREIGFHNYGEGHYSLIAKFSFEALVWIHGRQPGAGVVLHRLRTSLKFQLEIGHEMPPSPSLREPPLGNLFPLKLFAFHIHDKSFCPVRSIDSGRR